MALGGTVVIVAATIKAIVLRILNRLQGERKEPRGCSNSLGSFCVLKRLILRIYKQQRQPFRRNGESSWRLNSRGLVHLTGLEPALLSKIEPKSIAYANFATGAYISI